MAISAFAVLMVAFAIGVAVGSLGTAAVFLMTRPQAVEPRIDAPFPTDASNPYEPSRTTTRAAGTHIGCGVATVVLALVGLALLAALLWAGMRSVAPVRAVPVAPPPTRQPAPWVAPEQP